MTRVLRLFEYEAASVNEDGGFPLSLADAASLTRLNGQLSRRYGSQWDVLTVEFEGARPRRVRASSFVGTVSVGRKLIQILPKMARGNLQTGTPDSDQAIANLVYMLRYTRKIKVRDVGIVALSKAQGDILEALIFLFADNLLRLVQNDTYKQYCDCQDVLPYLKGKLLFSDQMKEDSRRLPRFAVAYDEFREDNLLNQVFLYVTSVLQAVTSREHNRRLLRVLDALFQGVTLRRISSADMASLHLNRLNQHFEPVLSLCRLFLQQEILQLGCGDTRTYSILFDMNVLFEEFIGEFIKRELRTDFEHIQLQGPRHNFVEKKWINGVPGAPVFQLKPDISLQKHNSNPVIVDTKYKMLDAQSDKEGVAQGDPYQMYAYARKYNSSSVIMLYPRPCGQAKRDICFQIDSDPLIRLFVRTVDLCRDLRREKEALRDELLESVTVLAEAETVAEAKASHFTEELNGAVEDETILHLGAEGGSLTILGRRDAQGGWQFRMKRDEGLCYDEALLDGGPVRREDYFEKTAWVQSVGEALKLLGRYPYWVDLYPVKLHPEFFRAVLDVVESRGGVDARKRWCKLLYRER